MAAPTPLAPPPLAALLGSGDPLVDLVSPLAGLLTLALFAGFVGELRRRVAPEGRPRDLRPGTRATAALLLLTLALTGGQLALRGDLGWAPHGSLAGLDAHEALRASGVAALGFAALALGLAWPRVALAVVGRAALGASLVGGLWLAGLALFGPLGPGDGLLGNTGYDLQVLLPGAALGLFLFARTEERLAPVPLVGALAFLAVAWFAALAPVVGGLLVLTLLGALALVHATDRVPVAGLVLVGLAAVPLGPLAGGGAAPTDGPAVAGAPTGTGAAPATDARPVSAADGHLGGLGVRRAIWGTLDELGGPIGTGQFQRAYPPVRSPVELAASTGGQTLAEVTEVEHPHSDPLLLAVEAGGGAALAWLLLAGLGLQQLVLRRRLGPAGLPLAAAALALPLAGAFHAPLLVNPLAAVLGWCLLGAWLAGSLAALAAAPAGGDRDGGTGPEPAATPTGDDARLPRPGAALAAELAGPSGRLERGVRLVLSSLALALVAPVFDWRPLDLDDLAGATPDELATVEAAREAAVDGRLPYDVLALHARSLEAADPAAAAAFWDLALDLRPHAVEALVQRGKLDAAAGDLAAAEARWTRADVLYPGYPPLAANLRRLGADLVLAGRLERGLTLLRPVLVELDVDPDQAREPAVLLQVARLVEDAAPSIERAALAAAAHHLQARRLADPAGAADAPGALLALGRAVEAADRELAGLAPAGLLLHGPDEPPPAPTLPPGAAPALAVEAAALEAALGRLDAARAHLAAVQAAGSDPRALAADAPHWVATAVEILLGDD